MKFLADECCPRGLVGALRGLGHEVRYAAETDARSPDDLIAAIAIDEGAVVLTADYDFGELAIRHRLSLPGVVLLAFQEEPVADRVLRALQVIADVGNDLLGKLTIISMKRVRVRPMD